MPTLASACQQLRVAACDGVYCLIVWPHFPHLMTRALVLKRKEALADCEVMFCCHLICQCLLLHGWVTLVGGYAAFLYQIVWIFVYMCALLLGIRIYGGASARDAACRWTPLQCCLIDGANVKCDFCLSWWVNNWIEPEHGFGDHFIWCIKHSSDGCRVALSLLWWRLDVHVTVTCA